MRFTELSTRVVLSPMALWMYSPFQYPPHGLHCVETCENGAVLFLCPCPSGSGEPLPPAWLQKPFRWAGLHTPLAFSRVQAAHSLGSIPLHGCSAAVHSGVGQSTSDEPWQKYSFCPLCSLPTTLVR